jgi:Mlc titration factor MtfA (ptsG expression regulator)
MQRVVPREVPPPDFARRAQLRATPLPEAWRLIIERELPHWQRLTEAQRAKLLGDVHVFLTEKPIIGIEGFEVTDRARVLVAASAALLALGLDISIFDHVRRIAIRPDIVVEERGKVGGFYQPMANVTVEGDQVIETWGDVELSWPQLDLAFRKLEGANTPIHELAHAFDHADGKLDSLMAHAHYDRWRARLHGLVLDKTRVGDYQLTETVADVEGPELFAVATELFFEAPRRLHKIDAELYEALYQIYGIDMRTVVDR